MYQLHYYNERSAQWKPAGVSSPDLDVIREHQFKMIRDTQASGASIRFRVVQV